MQGDKATGTDEPKQIGWDDFAKVDIRLGTIVSAQVFEAARKPAYILHVDFGGEMGVKKSSAQITALYTPEKLLGKRVFAVVNFPPRQIAHIMSECLVLGVHRADGAVVLATPDADVAGTAAGAETAGSVWGAPDGARLL